MEHYLPEVSRALERDEATHGAFEAVVFFIDITGFTNLTENLMQHGKEGAELLHTYLEKIFSPIVKEATAKGGIIPYYAGDAFLIIFETLKKADFNALCYFIAEQAAAHQTFTSKFGAYAVHFKAGVSAGKVAWGMIGTAHKHYYFRGIGIERAIAAWKKASSQTVNKDVNACNLFFERRDARENFNSVTDFNAHSFAATFHDKVASTAGLPQPEFQWVATLFIAFGNVNTHEQLNRLATLVADATVLYGGYLKEIDFTDKGGLILVYFGAPRAYENSVVRASECALQVAALFEQNALLNFRMGLSFGKVFAGYLGSTPRLQYGMLGSRVNLAARLALEAPLRKILVDSSIGKHTEFESSYFKDFAFKGFAEKQAGWLLLHKKTDKPILFLQTLVGREKELAAVLNFINSKIVEPAAQTYTISVSGESGIGKSHFMHELKMRLMPTADVHWITCPSDQILHKPYNAFIYYLKNFFQQNTTQNVEENVKFFQSTFQKLVQNAMRIKHAALNELLRTESFLAALLGLQEKNSLFEKLDAKGRYDNTFIALTAFFSIISAEKTTVIELEDVHWLDEASAAFLKHFSQLNTLHPQFIFFVSRTEVAVRHQTSADSDQLSAVSNQTSEIRNHSSTHSSQLTAQRYDITIELKTLNDDILHTFALNRLHGAIAPSFKQFLIRTTQGNPFYAEQVLAYLRENNLLISSAEGIMLAVEHVPLSESLQSVLIARIDTLSQYLRETVKVAAVIGREFEIPILSAVLSHTATDVVKGYVLEAERVQIWRAMSELRYIFRHTLLRQAVYDMQLHSQLQMLHRHIADAIEKIYAHALPERYIDLAFHYERATDAEKTYFYLKKAAEYAADNYQNQTALDLYDRLLKLEITKTQKIKILIRKGELLRLIGHWYNAENCFTQALLLAQNTSDSSLQARAHNMLGALYLLMGDYKRAADSLIIASGLFENLNDMRGITKNYGFLGTLHFRQGNYLKAESYYLRCQQISLAQNWKNSPQIIANLGLTYMNLSAYKKGIDCISAELLSLEIAKDTIGIGILYVNLGIIWVEKDNVVAALPCFEKGLTIGEQTGDKQLCSIALGCIGNVWRLRGEFYKSEDYLLRDLEMCESLGDVQGLAIVHELIARLHITKGEFAIAIDVLNKSLHLAQKINYLKGIAKAMLGLGEALSLLNQFEAAHTLLNDALIVTDKMSNPLVAGQILLEKGFVYLKQHNITAVSKMLGTLQRTEKQLGNRTFSQQLLVLQKKCADLVV